MAAKKTAKRPFAAVEVEMVLARETKGTFRYENDEDDSPVTTLYVRKSAFEGSDRPENILLLIEGA